MTELLSPPRLTGLTWRSASLEDVPALEHLQLVLNGGYLDDRERTDFRRLFQCRQGTSISTLCAVDAANKISGFASAIVYSTDDEHRGDLDCLVDPAYRGQGIGSLLLNWAEKEARDLLATRAADRPSILRIAFEGCRDGAHEFYHHHGFRFSFTSLTMRRDISCAAICDCPSTADIALVTWDERRTHLFYHAYVEAFGGCAGYTLLPEPVWHRDLIQCPAFHSDLSALLLDRAVPIAYVICWVDRTTRGCPRQSAGWIAQLGVSPLARRRGLGSLLLTSALQAFQREGLNDAMLEVKTVNFPALRLYEGFGFRPVGQLTVFTKAAGI